MRVPRQRRVRTGSMVVIAMVAIVTGACSAAPDAASDPSSAPTLPPLARLFEGGVFPIEVVVEPQTVTAEFQLFGVIPCTSTTVTPSVDVRGTLTVAPATIAADLSSITIPGASLSLPGASISAGSISLACGGVHLGAIGVSLDFDASASVRSVVLDPVAGTLTVADASLTLSNVRASFAGAPPGTSATPLAPVTVTTPTISIDV